MRAIVGACGYFAHFQQDVARAVNVPVFLSSLCQLPMIKTAVSDQKKIAILAASGDNIGEEVLQKVGTTMDRLVVENIGNLPEFHAIRYGETGFDNEKLKDALCLRVEKLVKAEPQINGKSGGRRKKCRSYQKGRRLSRILSFAG